MAAFQKLIPNLNCPWGKIKRKFKEKHKVTGKRNGNKIYIYIYKITSSFFFLPKEHNLKEYWHIPLKFSGAGRGNGNFAECREFKFAPKACLLSFRRMEYAPKRQRKGGSLSLFWGLPFLSPIYLRITSSIKYLLSLYQKKKKKQRKETKSEVWAIIIIFIRK